MAGVVLFIFSSKKQTKKKTNLPNVFSSLNYIHHRALSVLLSCMRIWPSFEMHLINGQFVLFLRAHIRNVAFTHWKIYTKMVVSGL